MALSMMDRHEDVCARLAEMELVMRQENAPSGVIEIIKSYRIAFQSDSAE